MVHLEDGRWGGIEIKLGGDDLIDEGVESLKTLRNKIIEKSDEKAPSFLLVLTAVGGAYKRDDGVYVAPINLLKLRKIHLVIQYLSCIVKYRPSRSLSHNLLQRLYLS